jgi:signal transduction histidine kinase
MIREVLTRLMGGRIGGYVTIAAMTFVAAVITGAYTKGWVDRGTREELRVLELQQERRAQAVRIAVQAELLADTIAERNRLAEELENAAREDVDADQPALGADSVRRLQLR